LVIQPLIHLFEIYIYRIIFFHIEGTNNNKNWKEPISRAKPIADHKVLAITTIDQIASDFILQKTKRGIFLSAKLWL